MSKRELPTQPLVLAVDDDEVARTTARAALESVNYRVAEAADGLSALERFDELRPDIVLLDVSMPRMDGFEVCSKLRSLPSGRHLPIMIMTGLADLTAIEEAFSAGATDFEVKPVRWVVTLHRIDYMLRAARASEKEAHQREVERQRLTAEVKELRQALQQAKLTYRSPEMESVIAVARRVAPTDATVLITGESGTGKELLARTLHELSARKGKARVIVDCGSIPTTLIESELFGHVKGAFTGASTTRVGRLAEADGGLSPPAGQWLADDAVSLASAAAGDVRRRSAALVGLAETTYRRRLDRIESSSELPAWRPESWTRVVPLLQRLLEANRAQRAPLLDLMEASLVRQIVQQHPRETKRGAALFGVSLPTFRRRVKALHRSHSGSGIHHPSAAASSTSSAR